MVIVIKKGSTKKEIDLLISKYKIKKTFNSKKHSGVIAFKELPLLIQKNLRNEWV